MKYLILFSLALLIISCERYQEQVLPVVGVYEANIVGVNGPFSISVSADFGNNVLIDAPFDGENWSVIEARVRDDWEIEKEIIIRDQRIDDGVRIRGRGIFFDYSLQLDYTITVDGVRENYTLVGTKF
jgi:hypothetical protein